MGRSFTEEQLEERVDLHIYADEVNAVPELFGEDICLGVELKKVTMKDFLLSIDENLDSLQKILVFRHLEAAFEAEAKDYMDNVNG